MRDEERALVEAGLAVLRRQGSDGLTVGEVLAEAGLSTRAFYRHFDSKDSLILAIFAYDAKRAREQMGKRLAACETPRAALDVWIDETLALAFDTRRASRTRPLAREGLRLQSHFPGEFDAILAGMLDPLVGVLRALETPDPVRDARSMHAVTWELVVERLHGSPVNRAQARAHVDRFCLPALGLNS